MSGSQNIDIREVIKGLGFRNYEVAEKIGIREETFSRMLRRELPSENKNEIFTAVEELSAEREARYKK